MQSPQKETFNSVSQKHEYTKTWNKIHKERECICFICGFLFEFCTSKVAFCVFSAAEYEGKGSRRQAVNDIKMKAIWTIEVRHNKVDKGERYQMRER